MSNSRNPYSAVPATGNQLDLYDSNTRFSGQQLPAFYSRNSLSGSDSSVNRRLLEPWGADSGPFSSTIDPIPSHPPRQIPIRSSNGLQRQQSERPRPAIIPQPVRPQSSARFTDDEVLKKLTKETYNPAPKSQLLRNLSLYYRNQNRGGQNFADTRDSDDEDGKRCVVCLEEFEAKETVTVTPCKHMFHEECIVPWLKRKGQCPVCRTVICEAKGDASPVVARDMTVNDLFSLELLSVVRALEESFLFGYPRHL